NILTIMVAIASLSIQSAYASDKTAGTDLVSNKTVTIEQNSSEIAKVTAIKVIQKGDTTNISGKVLLFSIDKKDKRREIPGHVDIAIVDENGSFSNIASIEYRKINIRSRDAKFSYDLKNTPKSGSKIIISHNAKKHDHKSNK
ncbi:MAG: hypothetical protein ACC657_14635, partial [Thiohalomonadales bacterium]